VIELLDQLESIEPAEVVEQATDPITVDPTDKDPVEDDDNTALLEYLKGVLSDEEYQKVCAMVGGDAPAMDDDKPKPDVVTKTAMDAAIAVASKAASKPPLPSHQDPIWHPRSRAFVRPWVGDLAMSFDSAEGVYRHTSHCSRSQGRRHPRRCTEADPRSPAGPRYGSEAPRHRSGCRCRQELRRALPQRQPSEE
jgi:hypothetical protein